MPQPFISATRRSHSGWFRQTTQGRARDSNSDFPRRPLRVRSGPRRTTRRKSAAPLLALIGCSGTPPLRAGGSRSDTPPVDQGITSEDKSKPAEPEPVIETSPIPQEEFSTHLSEVQKTLERSTVNPNAQLSGTVLIDFTIAPSGQVLTREVEKSSGSKVSDDAAIIALDPAAPFPPMPRGVAKGPLKLQVPVEFVTR